MAHRELLDGLKELSAEHFDTEAHRRIRAELIGADGPAPDAALLALQAELECTCRAGGDHAGHGDPTLLHLRERKLRRDLQGEADLARVTELQAHLAKGLKALGELA